MKVQCLPAQDDKVAEPESFDEEKSEPTIGHRACQRVQTSLRTYNIINNSPLSSAKFYPVSLVRPLFKSDAGVFVKLLNRRHDVLFERV